MMVLEKPHLVAEAVRALADVGLDAMCFSDPSAAWETLDTHQNIDLLITKPRFPAGVQNGVSWEALLENERR